ncbi:hypothetical protein Bca4012_006120 [Brassica carinata]
MVNMTEIRREGEDMPPSHRHRIITTRQLQCGLYACSWDERKTFCFPYVMFISC